ncbi:MAG: glycosyltransferase family 4 protein [Actinobacteria bacterium]|nr:glycosyltransferase family 4 protein [Actinomycetota bacterium]MCL6105333.1 glycosyltransferase family 4 protein [Actinomycetota bacterium]
MPGSASSLSVLIMAHSMPPYEFSGVPLVAHTYAKGLINRGFRVGVVYPRLDDPTWKKFTIQSIPGEGFIRYEVPFTIAPKLWPLPFGPLSLAEGGDEDVSSSFFGMEHRGENWSIGDASTKQEILSKRDGLFVSVLEQFSPDILHVIDNVYLPVEWPQVAKEQGVKILRHVCGAEDICAFIVPFDEKISEVCSNPGPNCCKKRYREILLESPPLSEPPLASDERSLRLASDIADNAFDALLRKRTQAAGLFDNVYNSVIFPTKGFYDYFCSALPIKHVNIKVVPHGISYIKNQNNASALHEEPEVELPKELPQLDSPNDERVNLVFMGFLEPRKGIGLLEDAFLNPALKDRKDYWLHIFAPGDLSLLGVLMTANQNVIYHGAYEPTQLPEILAKMNVGLSVSLFETFHRVTREYLLFGLPVVASNMFWATDVVVDHVNGMVFTPGDVGGLIKTITTLLDDPKLLHKLSEGAKSTKIFSVDQELDKIVDIYQEICS